MNNPAPKKNVFQPKSNPTEGAAKALGFSEQLKELKKEILSLTISTNNDTRPMKRQLGALQEVMSAVIDLLGPDEVGKKLDERRILKLEAQDQSRQEHITMMLTQKRIEAEETVRGATENDMGSFVAIVEYAPGNPENPTPGSFTFMPLGAGNPKELLAQFVDQKVGFEVALPNLDPETKEPVKDAEGKEVAPGRLVLLGIYKALPGPEAKPEAPADPAPAPDAPPTPEAAEVPAPEATA